MTRILPAALVSTVVLSATWAFCWTPAPVLADAGQSKILGSIEIGAGEHAEDLSTVNGGIHIGENAVVGHAETVNGNIVVGARASVGALDTVNGSIRLADGVHVSGSVQTVNGGLRAGKAAEVRGDLTNVSGDIEIDAAHIEGSIETVAGDINVGANAQIDGGIHVQESRGIHIGLERIPRIVIGPGAVVKGRLRFDRKVKLYVSDHAKIGSVEGATPEKFSGDHPTG